jgi:hypothetical protein
MKRVKPSRSLWDYLGHVPDTRSAQGRRFSLQSILGMVVGAFLCGRRDMLGIARWAEGLRGKPDLLRALGVQRDDTPCHVTFHNVLSTLNLKSLEQMLWSWAKGLVRAGVLGQLPVDGKVIRGSRSGKKRAVQLIAAYCCRMKGVLKQTSVGSGNEPGSALKLLTGLPLDGAIVSGDAIYADKRLSRKIIDQRGDYVFLVKDNKPGLRADIEAAFEGPFSPLRTQKAAV